MTARLHLSAAGGVLALMLVGSQLDAQVTQVPQLSQAVLVTHATPDPVGTCTVPVRPAAAAISSTQYRITPPCVDSLRAALRAQAYDKALRIYFSSTYNPKLANWVVFIQRDGTVRQAVVQRGAPRHLLRAEKYVYAAVFLEEAPARDTVNMNPEWPSLELSRRSIDYSQAPFTQFMVSTLAAGRMSAASEPKRSVSDLDRSVKLRRISEDSSNTLWFGSARLEVGDNTDVQLSLNAVGSERLPAGLARVYTTVNNATASRWEFGLTIGSSLGPSLVEKDANGTTTSKGAQSNIFLSSYLNILRPHLPRAKRSIGIVAGSNIARGTILDEILFGTAFGRLVGDAGAVVGVVFHQVQTTRTDLETGKTDFSTKRVPRLFLGFDLRM